MKNSSIGIGFLVFWAVGLLAGCSTEFDVYAPEKEIKVVYGILNPQDSIQTIRISNAYQVEGDAIEYAGENDLSVPGLDVRLSGNGNTWTAEEAIVPKDTDGIFTSPQTVYQFRTDGSDADHELLEAGQTYRLEIGTPDAGDYITGETTIPDVPQIRGPLNLVAGAGSTTCLPKLFLDRDFRAFWRKSQNPTVKYELRVTLYINDDGEDRAITWKNFKLIENNVRCNEGSNVICYQFEEYDLLAYFKRFMPEDGSRYTYITRDSCVSDPNRIDELPRSLAFEVSSIDEFLGNYIVVNDPANQDLTAAKPEYTNLSGNTDAYGVFGSINTDLRWAILRECSEAVLGLNDRLPPIDCDLIE